MYKPDTNLQTDGQSDSFIHPRLRSREYKNHRCNSHSSALTWSEAEPKEVSFFLEGKQPSGVNSLCYRVSTSQNKIKVVQEWPKPCYRGYLRWPKPLKTRERMSVMACAKAYEHLSGIFTAYLSNIRTYDTELESYRIEMFDRFIIILLLNCQMCLKLKI